MTQEVSWRRALVALVAVTLGLTGVVVALRADGFAAVDATVPRATRWFVHQATGRVVLADGFSGRSLARLDVGAEGDVLEVAQSASGVAVLDRSSAVARAIDASALRIGPPQSVSLIAEPAAVVGIGQPGLVAVDPPSAQATLVPPAGDPVPFDVGDGGVGDDAMIARDGSVWTIVSGSLSRITTTGRSTIESGLHADARFTLVGNAPLILDVDRARVQFRSGDWFDLPDGVPRSEIVLQEPGPADECGWVAADDQLWCVGDHGLVHEATVDRLDVDGSDLLAIAGDAGVLVRRAANQIVRIDWRSGEVLDDVVASVPRNSELEVAVSTDLVWVDQTNGGLVWAVHPWGINAIKKNDASTPLLGESGVVLDAGQSSSASAEQGSDDVLSAIEHEPDDNGIDDPPVAVDDPVTARTGAAVPIAVTANDYDPDGEAIVLAEVGDPSHGSVEIGSASTVVYQPESGYVGLDRFEYTIVDGNGTPASATVTIDLLPVDATNRAPIGSPDTTETGPDAEVMIDVLLNDIDPERDALRIESFTPPDVGGEVTEATAPSGLPGLRFTPPLGASGTATFTYRPVDSFGAVGEPVSVQVEIAQPTDENRPPVVRPDAVRIRRNIETAVPVLANDHDPDGDRLRVSVVTPLPPAIDVSVHGDELLVTARAGADELVPFGYTVDDGHGHVVTSNVLVAVIADSEPNRPPIANADAASAVVGNTQLIDVMRNDSDPDGDPLILVSVERPDGATGGGSIRVQGDQIEYIANEVGDDDGGLDRFTYVITDGNGHEAEGDVTVRVLPELIAAPPFAQDDNATTTVDQPVTVNVLRNDGDPSGERPTLVNVGCAAGGTATITADDRVTFRPPVGEFGVFRCSYEVTNTQGLRDSATITVSVLEPPVVNVPPKVQNESYTVELGDELVVDVLANDSDPDGSNARLQVLSSTAPSLGSATRLGGVITYQAGSVTGTVVITYQVGDDDGGVTTGRLLIRIVEPVPQAPVAAPDQRTVQGPAPAIAVAVLSNDFDPDGERTDLEVIGAELTTGRASVEFTARELTIAPDADMIGDIVVSYTIEDLDGLEATGLVVMTVLAPLNRPPVAGDDQAEVVNGGSVTIPIAINDSDPDGDDLTYAMVSSPSAELGTARLTNRSITFDAVPGATGVANIGYQVDDGDLRATANVQVTVLPCSAAPPEAPDVFLQTPYQTPIGVDLSQYARNGEIVQVGPPLGAPSGTYTPPAGENGNVAFEYVVRNSCRISDVGQVVIDVNQDPVGSAYLTQMGRLARQTVPVSSLASDAEALTIIGLEGAPVWVAVADQGRSVLFDPAGRTGTTNFTAIVADPGGLSVRVPITVDLVNLAPVANADNARADNGAIVISPLANDTDPDGDAISLASVPTTLTFPNGQVGTIEQTGPKTLRVNPQSGIGAATFSYTIVDALGLSSSPATVTVTVNSPPRANDAVITVPAGGSVTRDVPASDADGDPLTVSIDGSPGNLTIQVDGMRVTISAPAGAGAETTTVPYQVTDGHGGTAQGFLSITVEPKVVTTTTTTPPTTTTTPPTTTTTPPTTTTTPPTTTTQPPATTSTTEATTTQPPDTTVKPKPKVTTPPPDPAN